MTVTSAPRLAAGRWTVDITRSTATFRVGNLGGTVTGTVPVIGGTVDIGADGRPTAIDGSVDLGSVDTGNARRDKDLRKASLLDLDSYPIMTFSADAMTISPGGWSVAGQLTAKGTRVGLDGDVRLSVLDHSASLIARIQLDRRALGVRAPRLLIGHQVDITVTAIIRPVTAG